MADFKVPVDQAIFVHAEPLAVTAAGLLRAAGLSESDAALAADVVVSADLRGVDSHGVSNMLRVYADRLSSGVFNARAELQLVRETPSTARVDSQNGLGVVTAPKAMRIAIDKARATGVGMVSVGNGRHLGMAAYHSMLALPHDMIGICMTSAGPSMVPTWGGQPRLGTNPISVAVPCGEEPAFVYDGATTAVAGNKINNARRNGQPVPPGLLASLEGTPIPDAVLAPPPTELRLLPLGSTPETGSHKGYGLALMVETLCTMLSGTLPFGLERDTGYKHFFAAYNISAFTDVDTFKEHMDQMLEWLRETKPAAGQERVLYPGLLEYEEEHERREHGIPLHKEVIQWFAKITGELGLPPLQTL
jgi:LDH2 family malate/lactate/ureidoglycolate dehydrogenase